MIDRLEEFATTGLGETLINLLWALLILIVGYILARLIASVVRRLLHRTNLDNRIAAALTEEGEEAEFEAEEVVGRITFWLLMLFVIVAFLDQLNLPAISGPLSLFLDDVTTVYLPRLAAAGILLAIAWLVATVLRFLVRKGAQILKVDERLTRYGALEEGEQVSVGESLATAIFWFVFLLFLPAVLNALGIASIAQPVQDVFDSIIGYLPNVLGAALVLLIGWLAARVIREVVTNLLAAVGVNRLGVRAGLTEERTLADIIGTVIYVFIMLVVLVAALEQLDIEAISAPTTLMLTTIINYIPLVLAAAAVLVIAYAIGRVVADLVADLLASVGFNRVPEKLGLSWSTERPLSDWVGYLTLVVIMIFAATSAVEILGLDFLTEAFNVFVAFLWRVVLALVVFALGLYFANLAHRAILASGANNASFLATVARVAVIVFAGAMGLRQLGIADDIVNLAFGITLGAIAVAAALAFGLGSRDVAGRQVERLVADLRTPEPPEPPLGPSDLGEPFDGG